MAKKKSAKQDASGSTPSNDSRDSDASKVSRKVLRGVSASYERKDEDRPGKEGDKGNKGDEVAVIGQGMEAAEKKGLEEIDRIPEAAQADAADVVSRAKPATTDAAGSAKPAGATDADPGAAAKKEAAPAKKATAGDAPDAKPASAAAASGEEAPAPAGDSEASAGEQAVAAAPAFAELLPPHRIESGDPDAPAPPPGQAPPGDSRSFRRYRGDVEEFVLIYRSSSFLITRAGQVGRQGKWSVVEYPTLGTAAHAYAQECSRLTAEGYRDLRS